MDLLLCYDLSFFAVLFFSFKAFLYLLGVNSLAAGKVRQSYLQNAAFSELRNTPCNLY